MKKILLGLSLLIASAVVSAEIVTMPDGSKWNATKMPDGSLMIMDRANAAVPAQVTAPVVVPAQVAPKKVKSTFIGWGHNTPEMAVSSETDDAISFYLDAWDEQAPIKGDYSLLYGLTLFHMSTRIAAGETDMEFRNTWLGGMIGATYSPINKLNVSGGTYIGWNTSYIDLGSSSETNSEFDFGKNHFALITYNVWKKLSLGYKIHFSEGDGINSIAASYKF